MNELQGVLALVAVACAFAFMFLVDEFMMTGRGTSKVVLGMICGAMAMASAIAFITIELAF